MKLELIVMTLAVLLFDLMQNLFDFAVQVILIVILVENIQLLILSFELMKFALVSLLDFHHVMAL